LFGEQEGRTTVTRRMVLVQDIFLPDTVRVKAGKKGQLGDVSKCILKRNIINNTFLAFFDRDFLDCVSVCLANHLCFGAGEENGQDPESGL
jgi:hypothetical protein